MANTPPPVWVYNETIKMFATPGDPPFEGGIHCSTTPLIRDPV